MSNKVDKWGNWLNVIGMQIQNMLIKQDTHNTILKIIAINKSLHQHNLFYDHLFHTYIAYILVSLRRQLKKDKNSISMHGLLFDMVENKSCIPFHNLVSVDPEEDLKLLKQETLVIEDYVDKRIAHTDVRPLKKMPNPHEIDECIALIKDMHKRYNSVINKTDVELMPAMYDWIDIFTFPWVQK